MNPFRGILEIFVVLPWTLWSLGPWDQVRISCGIWEVGDNSDKSPASPHFGVMVVGVGIILLTIQQRAFPGV